MEDSAVLKALKKLRTWQKYSLIFVILHWILFYLTGYIINGHPPLPLLLLICPVLLVMSIINSLFNSIGIRIGEPLGGIIFILLATLIYAFIGAAIGSFVERRNKKR